MNAFTKQFLIISAILAALVMLAPAMALDANAQGDNNGKRQGAGRSMDDVARMIRQQKRWEILEATPRQQGSAVHYRFKVINKRGKVKIINIDPKKPNLRKLE